MIIGITGTIGAGKGTVVEYLKQKGFAHYSSSGTLKRILEERGLPQTRDYMSPLAQELVDTHKGGVLHMSYERAQKDDATNIVLEAIHRVAEADYVRGIGGVIWGVDADVKKRYERISTRGEGDKDKVTYEHFLEQAKREDEGANTGGHNIRKVIDSADAVLQNNGTQEELFAQVEQALARAAQ